jgi:hypothetical protein
VLLTRHYSGTCGTYGKKRNTDRDLLRSLKEKEQFEDVGADWRMTKMDLKEGGKWGVEIYRPDSAKCRVASSCTH